MVEVATSPRVKKWARRLSYSAVFLTVFCICISPSWRFVERHWGRDFAGKPPEPALVPVLIQSVEGSKYSIGHFPELPAHTKLSTEINDRNLDRINMDLQSRIPSLAKKPLYQYFRVLRRGPDYVDVSLEVPTTGDFWPKSWYRIQNGLVYPQRMIFLGPGFGMFVVIGPTLAGIASAVVLRFVLRWQRTRRSQTAPVAGT